MTSPTLAAPKLSKHIIWLMLLVSCLIVLQLAAAGQKSFWEDETWTATIARQPLADVLRSAVTDFHPPGYFVLAALWGRVFGYDELGLRLLSVVSLVATLLLLARLTMRLYGPHITLYVSSVYVLMPIVLMFGHNARYYALSALLSVGAAYAMVMMQQTALAGGALRMRIWLAAYVVASTLLLYVSYLGIGLILACLVCQLIWLRTNRVPDRIACIRQTIAAHVFMVILYVPWLQIVVTQASTLSVRAAPDASQSVLIEIAKRVFYLYYVYSAGAALSPLNPIAIVFVLMCAVAMVAFLAAMLKRRCSSDAMVLVFVAVIAVVSILINLIFVRRLFQAIPNQSFLLVPFWAMLIGRGLQVVFDWLGYGLMRGLLGVTLLLICGVSHTNYFLDREFLSPILTVPWREIYSDIRGQASSGAVVVCGNGDFACSYYAQRYGVAQVSMSQWLDTEPAGDTWYLQTNTDAQLFNTEQEAAVRTKLNQRYKQVQVASYAAHDMSVRRFKQMAGAGAAYDFRLVVYHGRALAGNQQP